MQAKTICLLLGSLNGAGAEKTLLTLAETFATLGHKVVLITLRDHSDYPTRDIQHITLQGPSRKQFQRQLSQLTSSLGTDLFITSKPDFYNHAVARKRLCSVHITLTAWLVDKSKRPLKHYIQIHKLKSKYQKKQLVALSEGIRDDMIDNLGCKPDNIRVIPNPYDLKGILEQSQDTNDLPDYPYIIYVASLIPRKRHGDLLKAFAHIRDKQIKLLLVGKGALEDSIRQQATDLGIEERVVLHGWDLNPYRLVKNARLSVLTSEAEGLPRTLVESLIIGTPIVSTDCPSGPREVLQGDLAKYLVPMGEPEKLAAAMEMALTDTNDLSSFRSERFDSVVVAKRYLNEFTKD